MQDKYSLGTPDGDSAWVDRGYGLGVMLETAAGCSVLIGHSGAGPGSVIAVYHSIESQFTCAAFSEGNNQRLVEEAAVRRAGIARSLVS
jgi:hypothetical protein